MLTAAELDREYNARAAIPEHPAIFTRWREQSAAVRAAQRHESDYAYGDTADERLDLFPAEHPGAPLLVFIHGGYWRSLDKSDFSFIAPPFVEAGIAVAVTHYGLAPATRLEDMVRQQLRALTWLYRNIPALGIDRRRIVVAGHSAGGHLAAMLAAADWPQWAADLPADLLAGILSISGLHDLVPLARTPFLAADLQLDEAAARRVSPISYRPHQAVPVITAVGAAESREFHRQSALLRSAWPHNVRRHLVLDGCHHLAAVETLAQRGHPLFEACCDLLAGSGT